MGVLKGVDDLVDGATKGLTVNSKCRPLVVVNVAGTKGVFLAPLSQWPVESSPYRAILGR